MLISVSINVLPETCMANWNYLRLLVTRYLSHAREPSIQTLAETMSSQTKNRPVKNFLSKIFSTPGEKKRTKAGRSNESDFEELFTGYSLDPFEYVDVLAVHTGTVVLKVGQGDEVFPTRGEWMQIPGTDLYEIDRERNPKRITATIQGTVEEVNSDCDGKFVEAGEKLMTIKHPLKKKEVIENILKDVLFLFPAPETANYSFTLEMQSKIAAKVGQNVRIGDGDEVFTMSLMKREAPVYYNGEKGVIYSVYFTPGVSVERGAPLIGVCTTDKLPLIKKIITRVKADWDRETEY